MLRTLTLSEFVAFDCCQTSVPRAPALAALAVRRSWQCRRTYIGAPLQLACSTLEACTAGAFVARKRRVQADIEKGALMERLAANANGLREKFTTPGVCAQPCPFIGDLTITSLGNVAYCGTRSTLLPCARDIDDPAPRHHHIGKRTVQYELLGGSATEK